MYSRVTSTISTMCTWFNSFSALVSQYPKTAIAVWVASVIVAARFL